MEKVLINDNDFKKVDEYFTKLSYKSKEIKNLLESLKKYGELILLGGAIRDILIKDDNPRDIDLIIDTNKNLDANREIDKILDKYTICQKNRFGGYKLNIDGIEFDICTMDNHWAFKNKLLTREIDNLKYSTFLDFDSIWYNLYNEKESNKYEYTFFNDCIESNQINIISNKKELVDLNPTKDINIIRILNIKNEWNLGIGDSVKKYVNNWVGANNNWVDELYYAQIKHYKIEKLKKELIKELVREVLEM